MEESFVSKRSFFITIVLAIFIIIILFFATVFDRRTKIVFCNVGQGDAAYIRIKNKIDVLIDAGPDRRVLDCLGKNMPFWDREIELAFLSHPNDDHYNGYFFVTDRYKIDKFITVNSLIVSKTYKKLLDKISSKNIPLFFKAPGDKIKAKNWQFIFYWPPINFTSSDDNDFSQILLFEENNFRVLFTGDASPFVLDRLSHYALGKIDILKVPHHGSKNGLTKNFLDLADPTFAVISVGKNNSYGHPSSEVLDMLKAKNIKIKRTDINGDIVFKLPN